MYSAFARCVEASTHAHSCLRWLMLQDTALYTSKNQTVSTHSLGASLQLAHSSIRVRSLIIWPSAQSVDFFLDRTSPQSQSLFCAVRDIYLTRKP